MDNRNTNNCLSRYRFCIKALPTNSAKEDLQKQPLDRAVEAFLWWGWGAGDSVKMSPTKKKTLAKTP